MSDQPSLRESLSKAFDESAAKDAAEAPEPAPVVEAAPEPVPEQETETQRAERTRDEAGRFAKAAKDAAKAEAPKPDAAAILAQPIGTPPEAPKVETVRPPQSLTPAEREAFAKAPPEIQAAIVRRERQQEVALMEASKSKQFASDFQRVIDPYMPLIRAGSGDPLKTVAGLLNTAHVLQNAPPGQKASLVAEIVKMYGVDIGALDAALSGQAPAQGAAPQFNEEALLRKAEERALARIQAQAQQAQQTRVQADLATFAGSHEFFEDVRETMGVLMERGLAKDLESAYKRACEVDPEISRVLSQREASKQAATGAQATQRARAASSSVKSSPASPLGAGSVGNDRRAQLEAAMNAAEGRT